MQAEEPVVRGGSEWQEKSARVLEVDWSCSVLALPLFSCSFSGKFFDLSEGLFPQKTIST